MATTSHTIGLVPTSSNANANANANSFYFFNAPPLEAIVHPGEKEDALPPGPTQWRESDYLDRAEMYKLMQEGKEWEYAFAQWLLRQEEYGNAFPNGFRIWLQYAIDHCPRFAKEQPRRYRG